jgi:hypothetical protein
LRIVGGYVFYLSTGAFIGGAGRPGAGVGEKEGQEKQAQGGDGISIAINTYSSRGGHNTNLGGGGRRDDSEEGAKTG